MLAEAADKHGMKKTLSTGALIAFGIGAVIGAGLFSITGVAAANYAGPGIIISFLIGAVGCAFAGLCYAEFSSLIPVSGSAYTYSYATLGEFVAWIIGWDLVLEYSVGAAIVASSWSGYLSELLHSFGYTLSPQIIMSPFETATLANGQVVHGILNLPSVFIVFVMSFVLMRGIKGSSRMNNVIVALKVSIVLIFIFVGMKYVNPVNFHPFIPANRGHFGEFGWSGVFRAAAMVFFAYIGFDAVSTTAQETKNPQKSMPWGILGSLFICTILYIAFAYVMTGVANYTLFNTGSSKLAPVATAISHMGTMGANGVIVPAYPWLNRLIIIAILLGYSSVILVMLLGQSRVFYSMSRDGLIPDIFSHLHPKYRTPAKCNMIFMVFVSLIAAFVPGKIIGDMCSIGSLFAFSLVCIGIIIVRKHKADANASFKTPLVPLIPILGVIVCMSMMLSLGTATWIRLVMWMIIGFDIYMVRGTKYSYLSKNDSDEEKRKTHRITAISGYAVCAILVFITFINHYVAEDDDKFMTIFSIAFVAIHIFYYTYFLLKNKKKIE